MQLVIFKKIWTFLPRNDICLWAFPFCSDIFLWSIAMLKTQTKTANWPGGPEGGLQVTEINTWYSGALNNYVSNWHHWDLQILCFPTKQDQNATKNGKKMHRLWKETITFLLIFFFFFGNLRCALYLSQERVLDGSPIFKVRLFPLNFIYNAEISVFLNPNHNCFVLCSMDVV